MRMRDFRNAGWCWQEKAALDVLRGFYAGDRLKQRTTAIALYVALTELASDQRTPEWAEVTHREVWEMTGTSESTVKRYLREFEELGLILVERRKVHQDINLPNVYGLLTPGSTDGPTSATGGQDQGSTGGPTPSTNGHHPQETYTNKEEGLNSVDRLRTAVRGPRLGRS